MAILLLDKVSMYILRKWRSTKDVKKPMGSILSGWLEDRKVASYIL